MNETSLIFFVVIIVIAVINSLAKKKKPANKTWQAVPPKWEPVSNNEEHKHSESLNPKPAHRNKSSKKESINKSKYKWNDDFAKNDTSNNEESDMKSNHDDDSTSLDIDVEHEDWRRAIILSEILKTKY